MPGMRTIFIISLFLLFLLEIGSRCYYKFKDRAFNIIAPNFETLMYPELKKIKNHSESYSILILGESVTESILFSKFLKTRLEEGSHAEVKIDNLSKYANTIMDSYYKYSRIKNHYEYVVISHGLCDCRMQYTPYSLGTDNYYFCWEYIKKKIVFAHPENRIVVTPMMLHLLTAWINYRLNGYSAYERKGRINKSWYHYGKTIKNNCVFAINLDRIVSLAKSKNEKLIIMPIAIYLADGYTENKFQAGVLDYKDKTEYPAEIYGDPENLEAFVSLYNKEMKQKESKNVRVMDIAIPRNGKYYRDICHLTDAGVEKVTANIADLICKE